MIYPSWQACCGKGKEQKMNNNLWIVNHIGFTTINPTWFMVLAQASPNQPPAGIVSTPVSPEQTSTALVPSEPNAARHVTSQQKTPMPTFWLTIGLMMVLMYLMLFRGPQKQKQQHKQMVQSLQKNDKVQTIGGVIGIVVDIKDDEITLKVDESNNTKIKIVPSAIGKNLTKEKKN
jgi:preprotein translocase subunit YajC